MKKTAILSEDRLYRYTLWRDWGFGSGYVVFIGLNPSTADENENDPTIRRCISFAMKWGYSALCMVNLFAYRATKPRDMMDQKNPVGELNDRYIAEMVENAEITIAAWGTNGGYLKRNKEVMEKIDNLYCLKITKNGHPGHPLYLPKNTNPLLWKSNNNGFVDGLI